MYLGRYLYSVPFIPSSPAALVLNIFFKVVIIAINIMVNGSGMIVASVPMLNVCSYMLVCVGNNSWRYYSHDGNVCIVGSVVAGGSSNLQKLAGLYHNSLCAHLLKFVIYLLLIMLHISINCYLKLVMCSLLIGALAALYLSVCFSYFLSAIPCGGNDIFYGLLEGYGPVKGFLCLAPLYSSILN